MKNDVNDDMLLLTSCFKVILKREIFQSTHKNNKTIIYKVGKFYMIYKTNGNGKRRLMFIKIKLCVGFIFFSKLMGLLDVYI
jgi:hypothetical protein